MLQLTLAHYRVFCLGKLFLKNTKLGCWLTLDITEFKNTLYSAAEGVECEPDQVTRLFLMEPAMTRSN